MFGADDTDALVAFFAEHGFAVVRGLYPDEQLHALEADLLHQQARLVPHRAGIQVAVEHQGWPGPGAGQGTDAVKSVVFDFLELDLQAHFSEAFGEISRHSLFASRGAVDINEIHEEFDAFFTVDPLQDGFFVK